MSLRILWLRPGSVLRRVLNIFAVLLLLLSSACEVPVRQCAGQVDCFGGEVCMDGECVRALSLDDADVPAPDLTDGGQADMTPGDCRLNEAVCGDQVCNVSTGRCEDCQRDLQCGDGGLCDMVTGRCTCNPSYHACGGQCVRNDDVATCGERCEPCPGVEDGAPACVDGACSFTCSEGFRPCTDDCPFDRDCIECETDAECTDPEASTCSNTGTCVGCQTNDDCALLDDNVCDRGTCVQCVTGDASACGNNSCNPATNLCTATVVNSVDWCETCVADSECKPNHRCVPMFFRGSLRPRAYCLEEANSLCSLPAPIQSQRDSLSGVRGEFYCVIREDLATCEAVNDYERPCEQNSDCGTPGLADALCRTFDGMPRCTYACTENVECSGGGSSCIGNPPDNSYCARF